MAIERLNLIELNLIDNGYLEVGTFIDKDSFMRTGEFLVRLRLVGCEKWVSNQDEVFTDLNRAKQFAEKMLNTFTLV